MRTAANSFLRATVMVVFSHFAAHAEYENIFEIILRRVGHEDVFSYSGQVASDSGSIPVGDYGDSVFTTTLLPGEYRLLLFVMTGTVDGTPFLPTAVAVRSGVAGKVDGTLQFSAPVKISPYFGDDYEYEDFCFRLQAEASAYGFTSNFSNADESEHHCEFPLREQMRREIYVDQQNPFLDLNRYQMNCYSLAAIRADLTGQTAALTEYRFSALSIATDCFELSGPNPQLLQLTGACADACSTISNSIEVFEPVDLTFTLRAEFFDQPGELQILPLIPNGQEGDNSDSVRYVFTRVPPDPWIDPPMAFGYTYKMDSQSHFTEILEFPVGIDEDNCFTVWAGPIKLGDYEVGQSVDFVGLTGAGVEEFTITGIGPGVEADDSLGFPLRIRFDTPTADFTMTPLTGPDIAISQLGSNQFEVTWPSIPFGSYTLQSSDTLSGDWTALGPSSEGTGATMTYTGSIQAIAEFFRVEVK